LWREFENHQTLQAHALRVNAAKASKDQFNGWDIKHRYLNQASSCFVPQRLQHQQDGARQLMGLLQLVERGLA
jgi:hypothetical protein